MTAFPLRKNNKKLDIPASSLFCKGFLIFISLLFTGSFFHHPVEYDNTISRFFLVSSIVDRGRLDIDDHHKFTIDDSFSRGHYYSNKSIGAPLLALPVYWLARVMSLKKTEYMNLDIYVEDMYMVRVITTTLPFAILGVALFIQMREWTKSELAALWAVLAYGYGSISLIHATLFSGHQVAASFSFFSFFLLYQIKRKNMNDLKIGGLLKSFFAGLCAGIGALCDYTAIYLALLFTLYIFLVMFSWKQRFLFILGGMVCLSLLGVYNYICFGSPLSFSYAYLAEREFSKGSGQGFMGISVPDLNVLIQLLFSPSRGLLFISPVFLFSIIGYREMLKRYKEESILVLFIVTGYLCINAGFYGWHGGLTYGPRYLVPMIPFLVPPMAFAINEYSSWFKVFFIISFAQISFALFGMPHVPYEYSNPIVHFIIPLMRYGYFASNGGELIGLNSVYSVILVILICLTLTFMLFSLIKERTERFKKNRVMNILFSMLIITMTGTFFFFTKPPPSKIDHAYKSRMLYSAGKATGSESLGMAGFQEELLITGKR